MLLNPLQSRRLLADALETGYAILAINADSPAAVTDCLEAARQSDAPVIIETSLWQLTGASFGAGDPILGMARYLADLTVLANSDRFASVPVVYHTDHIKGPDTLAILSAGIHGLPFGTSESRILLHPSTISLDASEFSEEENIEAICTLARAAKTCGHPVTLEMEAEVDEGVTPAAVSRRLIGAVEERHPGVVHLYAPGLGTQHGLAAESYDAFSIDHVRRNIDLLREITGRSFGLALHGSSGLGEEQLHAAAGAGVVKVNWSSESLLIRSRGLQAYIREHEAQFEKTHPDWKNTVMDNGHQSAISEAYIPRVRHRMEILRSHNQAQRFMQTLAS